MNTISTNTVKTMSSLEIVAVINSMREEGKAELRHDNFMTKIEKHPGIDSPKFKSTYKDSTGRTLKCYCLPERESLMMLATFNSTAQQKITDKFLENKGALEDVLKALQDFEVPKDFPEAFVYAIRNTVTGNVKLGISRNPEQRLKQLQTGNDCRLELVAQRKAENKFQDEAALHRNNANYHIQGEWFSKETSFLTN